MKPIQPEEITQIVGGEFHGGGSRGPVTGIAIDSRTTQKGDLFVAITTESNDGHKYVPSAFVKGAHAAFVSCDKARAHLRDWDVYPLIVVDEPVHALQQWATIHRKLHNIPVIAVTGSNGKTTAKEFIASAISSLGPIHKTMGNLNNHLGVPMTLLDITNEHKAAVVEMGMNHSGEVQLLGGITAPTIGVITNTGHAHLEYFANRDALIDAKWELAHTMTDARHMVLNRDDEGLRARASSYDGPISWYGIEQECEWHPNEMAQSEDGCWSFCVKGISIQLRVPGHHMMRNALAALVVADILNVPLDVAASAIESADTADGRMRAINVADVLILDDTYNANPASMKAALDTLSSLKRKGIAVLGGMRELGAESSLLHEEIGTYAAQRGIQVVAVGEMAPNIARGCRAVENATVKEASTHAAALDWLKEHVTAGDAVLVKGSRSEHMEIVVDGLRHHLETM